MISLDILMFLAAFVLLLAGFPVALTLAGVALLFAFLGADFSFVRLLPLRVFNTMTNTVLIAVPLFVFMGVMLERSKVAEDLLTAMGKLFGGVHGGLGISVTIVGALLAASTGIVGATVVTMGLLSLPTMLKRGYNPELATGAIAASGTLGQIIPPSIVLVLLGDVLSNAYQTALRTPGTALRDMANRPDTVSVGDLFAGALFPGLMLVGLYIGYQIFIAIMRPNHAPPLDKDERALDKEMWKSLAAALVPPLTLIIAVLGSILAGIASPTEAAAIGAAGAIMLAGFRLCPEGHGALMGRAAIAAAGLCLVALIVLTAFVDLRVARSEISGADQMGIYAAYLLCAVIAWGVLVSILRTRETKILSDVMGSTTQITSMVFLILIGAALFSLVFRGLGGDETVRHLLEQIPGGKVGALVAVMLVMFVLGFFLDFIEITFVVVPIVAPALMMMGINPVWLGVMMAINLQTSFLTPPFGFALFYLRGVAPDSVSTMQIYRGALPFVCIQLLALLILASVPALATWLPSVIYQ